ncbi:hypothetical protein OG982_26225 [Streptomyces sp. NBC_01551]|uniref:hypothetical protein n=1 Tax=Streptomyces sp. NBC_01551 TaxID=2975876 RepID=UPI00225AD896|nr:hypothetical protein [Streptomyces sp. NBC_01551]MCX4529147.1 hypothetical protein [Streptomyces sp. NBC_01551]
MEKLTAAELKDVFRLSEAAWASLATGMPSPLDPARTGGETMWSGHAFGRWLATGHPGLAGKGPLLLRPAAPAQPQYLGGACRAPRDDASDRADRFTGLWRTPQGVVVGVAYPLYDWIDAERGLLDLHDDADTVVAVGYAHDLDGPELRAVDRERPELVYHPSWAELAAHLGTGVPWWPDALRREEHLTTWRPGDEPRRVEVVTSPSWEPLYTLARQEPEGSPLRRACFTIGHRIRAGAADGALKEMADLRGRAGRVAASMVFPAVPETAADPGLAQVATDDIVGAGLAELCARTDDLAVECLEQVSQWSGAEDLPYGGTFNVMRTNVSRAAAEWINRLRAVPPTALHRMWEEDYDTVGTFVDPATGSPVVAVKGKFIFRDAREITYIGRAPKRLPAGSVLKEVILDDPIWVRTSDGVLYPAPAMGAPGLSWGYRGTGPTTLSECVGRLLDDGSAHAVTFDDDADEPGLREYFRIKHKRGTRISRRELIRVRLSS